ncbi:D-alanyl-D-alanine carboxypeptidase family protein [Abyssisolibacter fermentans]|uniref:D-alanyl-D-alanine carboxypeptidase family protein n=1 Tax=Abyssisolibacter fermentans TaxID=1766203 RepID=UPI000A4D2614|nr:D-alanyl-D-alanine carboxypeptidase family protein [Abyssisolibacter fermentans]
MNIYQGYVLLVNKKHIYHSQTVLLEPVDSNRPEVLLDQTVKQHLSRWIHDYDLDNKIVGVSGYRTIMEQDHLYELVLLERGKEYTKQYVAHPYASEHHTGYAIDLGLNSKNIDYVSPNLPDTPEIRSFKDNAWKYGFVQRYLKGKNNITGVAEEPWHFRYVGLPHSFIIMKHNFVLEEYIEWIKQYKYRKNPLKIKLQDIQYELSFTNEIDNVQSLLNEKTEISGNNVDGFIITRWK